MSRTTQKTSFLQVALEELVAVLRHLIAAVVLLDASHDVNRKISVSGVAMTSIVVIGPQ